MDLRTIRRRIMGLATRATIETADPARRLTEVQLAGMDGELDDGVELFESYGFTSAPLAGAEAVVLRLGGNRSHPVVVAFADRRHRPVTLQPGEALVYDNMGQSVHLKADGIAIQSPLKVTVEAPEVTVLADAVNLGGTGGAGVARIGDAVTAGVITGGSATVTAL